MVKRALIAAAVLALNVTRLPAAPAGEAWPAFREIDLEEARGLDVPAASPGSPEEFKVSTAALYTFTLPVENPAGLKAPIIAADKTRDLAVTAVRKSHGDFEAVLEVSGATDSFKVLKLAPGRYLVRGGEVNLTAAQDGTGKYLDISGTIPMPAANTVNFRLKISTDGTLTAEEPGYSLALRRERAAGELDLKLFSKADAACLIALGLAINSDKLDPYPHWAPPPEPGPWVRVPYKPGQNGVNPWGPRFQGSSPSTGGGSGVLGGGAAGSKAGSSSKKASGSSGGGGGGGGWGGSRGGGGGGYGRSSAGGGAWGGGSRGAGGNRGGGGSRGQFSNSRGSGRAQSAARGAKPNNGAAKGAGRAAPKRKPDAKAAAGRKNAKADRPKAAAAGKGADAGRKKIGGRRPEDSRSLARNVTNSMGTGKPRPFMERKAAEAKTPPAVKAGGRAAKAPRPKARLTARAFTKADNKLRSLGKMLAPQSAAPAAPPSPGFRDSLNDAPARNQPAQAAAEAKRSKRAPAALAGTVTALTRTAAVLANTVAAAVTTLGAVVSSVLTWLKTLA